MRIVNTKPSGKSGVKPRSYNENVLHDVRENQVWMLTSYPPRECGIATFSQDLKTTLEKSFGESLRFCIAAIDNGIEKERYPAEVSFIFHSDRSGDYRELAATIDSNKKIRALIIQHEFGLFHHAKHTEFRQMLAAISKPVILVMHTVLPSPPEWMQEHVAAIASASNKIVVMTKNAAALLEEYYHITPQKITVIPHGTHLIHPASKDALKEKYGLTGKTVLSTFGLISRNKSIETSIKALPEIVKKYPEVMFLVLGRTHPCVVKEEGESYREELLQLVHQYGLEKNVQFINHYLSQEEMLEYLQATDIYLFTSKDPLQAVSGTFSYALSAGCAIVSTPIPHAKEILQSGCGLLFDFEDPHSLQEKVLYYLDNPSQRIKAGEMAIETIAPTCWENVANQYHALITKLNKSEWEISYRLPEMNLTHLRRMTDETGLVQFARYHQPQLSSGYTLDDNARALIATGMYFNASGNKECLPLMERYLNFIKDCQLPGGRFLNYKNEDGSFSDQNTMENLDDANGRAMWALGYIVSISKKLPAAYGNIATAVFSKALTVLQNLSSPRSQSFFLKGLYYFAAVNTAYKYSPVFKNTGTYLVKLYKQHAEPAWRWFEDNLTYANALLPEALLLAYRATGNKTFRKVAKASFDFLLSRTFIGNRIKVIPNKTWLKKGEVNFNTYGEQPIDVAYTILALDRFYAVFKEESYREKIKTAYSWFLGHNHLHHIVYNPATGGCYDGVEKNKVNLNQGAESTVCHLMARMAAERYFTLAGVNEKLTLQIPVTTVA